MINKEITDINYKNWHNDLQDHLATNFRDQGYTVEIEKYIATPGGHKTRRRADILIESERLVIEVQKSKQIAKDFRERCDDYILAGYKVLWILNDNRWQPDTDQNFELSKEKTDIFIKWRDYDQSQNRAQYIYNSNRFTIIDYFHKNTGDVTIMYCIQSGGQSGLMYRKVESTTEVSRTLTPKFTDNNHFGTNDRKNHQLPRETFIGYEVVSSIIPTDTFRLKAA